MDADEYLLTSSQITQQWSACLWDYTSLNSQRFYKNGGTITPKTLHLIGNDYVLAAQHSKPLLHVWPLNSQEPTKNVRLILPEPANCLAVCPKSTFLAVGIGTKLYVWQISSGKLLSVQQKNFQPITAVKFSSDGDFLVIAGQDGMLITYNVSDLVTLHNNYLSQSDIGQVEPVYTKNDHSMPIRDIFVGCFGRKSRLVTVSTDQTARLYNLLTGDPLLVLTFEEPLTSVVFDSPCWQMFIGAYSGIIKQFNLKSPPRTLVHHVENKKSNLDFIGHTKKVICLSINLTNTILASGGEDNFVFTWEIKSRQVLKKIEHKSPITNLRFVLRHSNFSIDTFKPKIILKNLERNLELNNYSFDVSLLQDYDIELSDDENSLEKQQIRENLARENRKLRVVNHQLYNAALQISKKYNNV